jgi:hypothetical protein
VQKFHECKGNLQVLISNQHCVVYINPFHECKGTYILIQPRFPKRLHEMQGLTLVLGNE